MTGREVPVSMYSMWWCFSSTTAQWYQWLWWWVFSWSNWLRVISLTLISWCTVNPGKKELRRKIQPWTRSWVRFSMSLLTKLGHLRVTRWLFILQWLETLNFSFSTSKKKICIFLINFLRKYNEKDLLLFKHLYKWNQKIKRQAFRYQISRNW